ncbi:HNH endonuclease signature motif containing protein [Cellulomonas aerilata]|uniref:HNH endonuclease signature motif containing protein n=3 Tax=Cellulomonas aerilata TaxID=515326 RepID=UPI0031D45F84
MDDHEPDEPGITPARATGTDLSTVRPEVAELLTALEAVADAAVAVARSDGGVDGREAAVVAAGIAAATSRLRVVQARMLAVVEADGIWSVESRSLVRWAARRLDVSVRTAQAQVRLGRTLRDDLPLTAAAAAAGEIGVEHAHVLAALAPTSERRREALASPDVECDEAWLVRQAKLNTVDDLRTVVRHWAAAADTDADDRGYVQACERQHLQVSPTLGGYHVQGFLTVDVGQALVTALEAVTPVPAAGDTSTTDQRRAQAVGVLANLVLDKGLAGEGRASRPRLNVLVSYETLQAVTERAMARQDARTLPRLGSVLTAESVLHGPQFEDGTPIPRILLDRLACDGEFNRVIFGPQSEILDVGRAERTFTRARRNAIIARDRHCRFPGCTAPPTLSECHHVRHWARDHGSTSVSNGILLCWHHHGYVHARGIEIHRQGGRWVFTDAAGRELGDPCPDDEAG